MTNQRLRWIEWEFAAHFPGERLTKRVFIQSCACAGGGHAWRRRGGVRIARRPRKPPSLSRSRTDSREEFQACRRIDREVRRNIRAGGGNQPEISFADAIRPAPVRRQSVPKSTPIGLASGAKQLWTNPSILRLRFRRRPRRRRDGGSHVPSHTLELRLTAIGSNGETDCTPSSRERVVDLVGVSTLKGGTLRGLGWEGAFIPKAPEIPPLRRLPPPNPAQ